MRRWLLVLGVILGWALAGPAHAQGVAERPHTRVELLAETRTPAPGRTFTVGISFQPRPGWHTYWVNPGDAGMEPRAEWRLPAGATVTPLRFPVPKPYLVQGIMNHVYEGEAVLLADVTLPPGATGAVPLAVRLDWLVCDENMCVPESAELSLPLVVGDGAPDYLAAPRLAAARAALPQPLATPGRFQLADGRVRLWAPVAPQGVRRAHFFPLAHDVIDMAAPQALGQGADGLVLETAVASNPGSFKREVRGVLRLERDDGRVVGLELALRPGEVPPARPLGSAAAGQATFWTAFGLAVLGGLLLNLMPCVFPILSLKAMSLARAGASEAHARVEGLAYTLGVVASCLALGAVAIALARAGQGAGWAFQLQDPRVILFLMLLVWAIGLNFAGLFDVNLGAVRLGGGLARQGGAHGAFFTGALAAFVATPCTGPFMAGALGAALVLPWAAGLAVFAGLGLGLALPFLAIGFVPALRRHLPRPGPWMESFRRILAIPMWLTAVGLAWVLGRQAGVDAVAWGLLAALVLALGLWWWGRAQRGGRPSPVPALVAAAAFLAPLALPWPAALGGAGSAAAARVAGTVPEPFSPTALEARVRARTPTFLYFTADWCVTCKVNEKGALADAAVARAFRQAGIGVMVGDWTRPDPAIARFLAERGRAGIPLYLFYGADGRVEELPQILTVERLLALASRGSAAPA
ncbi:MAG: protein-disulfide reductase DsbD family protein [Sphingomonadaceae bacterium]|uniref:protein-disulfide reductase DsbD family protein n=1 Tax=Thermaurantiacus sp. TaxID=2820283 RepID=UPI00298EF690|nr:protein-disulfide reductase DsbD domain-containing protein [Thermaurantiacus sp.]MCS6985960.1 protein-disulfide reductase DsbD family protein [Sphingomonadaceae bacterium]MDW8414824.1 protein-disulfide reductase DsbD family protein [Thermaurantiacus sp.]